MSYTSSVTFGDSFPSRGSLFAPLALKGNSPVRGNVGFADKRVAAPAKGEVRMLILTGGIVYHYKKLRRGLFLRSIFIFYRCVL